MAVKLIIAGSRTVDPSIAEIDAEVLKLPIWGDRAPDIGRIGEAVSLVISGRSPGGGADAAGERWAAARGITVHIEPITDEDVRRWGKYLAPKMRNRRMAELGDYGLLFWDAKSSGTPDMCIRLVVRRKPVEVVPTKAVRQSTRRGSGGGGRSAGGRRSRSQPAVS